MSFTVLLVCNILKKNSLSFLPSYIYLHSSIPNVIHNTAIGDDRGSMLQYQACICSLSVSNLQHQHLHQACAKSQQRRHGGTTTAYPGTTTAHPLGTRHIEQVLYMACKEVGKVAHSQGVWEHSAHRDRASLTGRIQAGGGCYTMLVVTLHVSNRIKDRFIIKQHRFTSGPPTGTLCHQFALANDFSPSFPVVMEFLSFSCSS